MQTTVIIHNATILRSDFFNSTHNYHPPLLHPDDTAIFFKEDIQSINYVSETDFKCASLHDSNRFLGDKLSYKERLLTDGCNLDGKALPTEYLKALNYYYGLKNCVCILTKDRHGVYNYTTIPNVTKQFVIDAIYNPTQLIPGVIQFTIEPLTLITKKI